MSDQGKIGPMACAERNHIGSKSKQSDFGNVKQSAEKIFLEKANEYFQKQRKAGNHVDRSDIYYTKGVHAGKKLQADLAEMPTATVAQRKCALASEKRLEAICKKAIIRSQPYFI